MCMNTQPKPKEKLSIVKLLKTIWITAAPWEHIPTKYTYKKNELTVDFDFGNIIILKERDMTITIEAQPGRVREEFNIGDVKLLNKIEYFITENLIE